MTKIKLTHEYTMDRWQVSDPSQGAAKAGEPADADWSGSNRTVWQAEPLEVVPPRQRAG